MKITKTLCSFLVAASSLLSVFDLNAYLMPYETPLVKYLKPIEVTEYDSGIPMVECIYVINLDFRTDKWQRLAAIFDQKRLRANRMSAVVGRELTQEMKADMSGPYPVNLHGGEIGCLLSHISVLKDAYERGFNLIWVCEDDIEFLEDESIIPEFLTDLSKIDPKWDIFYTDTNCRRPSDGYYAPWMTNPRPDQKIPSFAYFNTRTPVGHDLQRIRTRFGTTSMIITRGGMQKILDYFTHVYLWCPIDWDLHYIPGIREYAPTRDVITNFRDDLPSDIHDPG